MGDACRFEEEQFNLAEGNDLVFEAPRHHAEFSGIQANRPASFMDFKRSVEDQEQLVLNLMDVPGDLVALGPDELDLLTVELRYDLGRECIAESAEALIDVHDLEHASFLPRPSYPDYTNYSNLFSEKNLF